MIVEWCLQLVVGAVGFIVDLFPDYESPQWFVDSGAMLAELISGLSGLGAWYNWQILTACVVGVLGAWGVMALIALTQRSVGR